MDAINFLVNIIWLCIYGDGNSYLQINDITMITIRTETLQLRNEFSVCRVYTSNGTLRSFDRRPLNPPAAGVDDQTAAAHRCQEQEAPPPPPAAAGSQMAAVDVVVAAANGGQSSDEHSHGGSSSSGSLGAVVDGAGDAAAAAAIDWDSLIPPVDYLRFGGADDLSHVVWPPN